MRIAVLGSGIIGTATAWWLRQDGHEVVVVDRAAAVANETTRATGGQISVSQAEPWAHPQAPLQLLHWLFQEDAPLLFRPRLDLAQWAWGLAFLRECMPGRVGPNIRAMVELAEYSRRTLREMQADLDIDYQRLQRGILNFYRDPEHFDRSQELAGLMRDFGVDRRIISADEVVQIEPALRGARALIVGGDYTVDDESGDAHTFTLALAERARAAGVQFVFNTEVTRLHAAGGRIIGAEVLRPDGLYDMVRADAYVLALGAYTPKFVRPLGVPCPVYPTKGYSATFPVVDTDAAPFVSLTDSAHMMVYSRMGNTVRMAGTAEMSGYSRGLNTIRCDSMLRRAQELFPTALDFANVRFWSGLRSTTPSNVPLIGQTKIRNLYLNTGHGTLGWTMGVGSGRVMADLIGGRQPEPEFPFLG